MGERLLLAVNPRSRSGGDDLRPVEALFADAGFDVERVDPETPEALRSVLAARAADRIVVAGGDGTLNAAAPVLKERGLPVGVLPLGTANDLARTLELPMDAEQAARVIVDGQTRTIDLGLVNGRPFFNVASLGLSTEVARFHTGERKRRLGVFAYPLAWRDAWRASRPFAARLICDGEQRVARCSILAVGNGRHYGGGMTLAQDARIDDGLLRAYMVTSRARRDLLRLLVAFRLGSLHLQKSVETFRGSSVRVETSKPKQLSVDGELADWTPAEFTVCPRALTVFCPATEA